MTQHAGSLDERKRGCRRPGRDMQLPTTSVRRPTGELLLFAHPFRPGEQIRRDLMPPLLASNSAGDQPGLAQRLLPSPSESGSSTATYEAGAAECNSRDRFPGL